VKHADESTVVCTYDVGSNLQDALQKWGEDVVFYNFVIGAKTSKRNKLFSLTHGKEPKSAEEALLALEDWVPSVGQVKGKDKADKAMELFNSMTDEERQAFLDSLNS